MIKKTCIFHIYIHLQYVNKYIIYKYNIYIFFFFNINPDIHFSSSAPVTHWLLFFSIAKASKIGRWILDFQSGRLGRRKPTKGGRVRYYWWDQLPASTGAGFQPSTVVWDLFRLLRLLKRQGSLKILVGFRWRDPFERDDFLGSMLVFGGVNRGLLR